MCERFSFLVKKYLFIKVDYEHGFIATLRTEYGETLQTIYNRNLNYLRNVARNNKASIVPRRFA